MHGGGFYHIQKYLVAPEQMPDHLTWFKWESYATWLSGFAMLCIVYYAGANLFLVDRSVADIPAWGAIVISLLSLSVGWLLYDSLCKSRLAANPTLLMVILFGILVAMAWGYTHVFSGRAALLHLGAFTATIMSANVFLVIIPNQEIVVADLKAGRIPDPKYGAIAKLRSTHNNYLTLPVLFLMLSNHYPLAFATEYNWIIASLVFLMGVTIRHYFNTVHARKGNPTWTWAVTAIIFVIIMWLSSAPGSQREELAGLSPMETRFASAAGFHPSDRYGERALLNVPHRRAVLSGYSPGAEGGSPRNRRGDRRARPRDISAGRAVARDAAGQCHRNRAIGAAPNHRLVPGSNRRLRRQRRLRLGKNSPIDRYRLCPIIRQEAPECRMWRMARGTGGVSGRDTR